MLLLEQCPALQAFTPIFPEVFLEMLALSLDRAFHPNFRLSPMALVWKPLGLSCFSYDNVLLFQYNVVLANSPRHKLRARPSVFIQPSSPWVQGEPGSYSLSFSLIMLGLCFQLDRLPKAKGEGPFTLKETRLGYESSCHWSMFSEGKAYRFTETKLAHHITLQMAFIPLTA